MKTIYEIDKDGYMTYRTEEFTGEVLPEGFTDTPLPTDEAGNQLPFWRPKWDGKKWTEGRPQADIDKELAKPTPLSHTQLVSRDIEAVAGMVAVVAEESFMLAEETYAMLDSISVVKGDAEALAMILVSFATDFVAMSQELSELRTEIKTIKGE